jgi:hypothetical protein
MKPLSSAGARGRDFYRVICYLVRGTLRFNGSASRLARGEGRFSTDSSTQTPKATAGDSWLYGLVGFGKLIACSHVR